MAITFPKRFFLLNSQAYLQEKVISNPTSSSSFPHWRASDFRWRHRNHFTKRKRDLTQTKLTELEHNAILFVFFILTPMMMEMKWNDVIVIQPHLLILLLLLVEQDKKKKKATCFGHNFSSSSKLLLIHWPNWSIGLENQFDRETGRIVVVAEVRFIIQLRGVVSFSSSQSFLEAASRHLISGLSGAAKLCESCRFWTTTTIASGHYYYYWVSFEGGELHRGKSRQFKFNSDSFRFFVWCHTQKNKSNNFQTKSPIQTHERGTKEKYEIDC